MKHVVTQEDRNILRLQADTGLQGIASAGVAVYLSVYVVRLGARPFEVALLTSLPALLMVLVAIPAAAYVERQLDLIRTVVWVRFVYYLGPLAIAILLWTPLGKQPMVVVATWALFSMAFGAFPPAWMAAMPYIVPRERMLSVTGDRWAINGALTAVAVAAFGALLDRIAFPASYQVVFFISFAAALLGLSFYTGIRIPRRTDVVYEVKSAAERLRVMGRALSAHRDFLRFLLALFIYQLATWLPDGLYPVFWVRDLHASEGWIGLRTMMLGYFAWGRLSGQLGRRRVLVFCVAAMGLYPALTALAPTAVWLVPIAAVRGLCFSGIEIVLFEALLAKSPAAHRPSFVATGNLLDGLARLSAPLFGAGLANVWNIRAAMFVGAGVYLAAAVLFRALPFEPIREHREAPDEKSGSARSEPANLMAGAEAGRR